jgi:hypothetical protein
MMRTSKPPDGKLIMCFPSHFSSVITHQRYLCIYIYIFFLLARSSNTEPQTSNSCSLNEKLRLLSGGKSLDNAYGVLNPNQNGVIWNYRLTEIFR